MNGYTLLANSYKKLMNEGEIDKETAEKEIRILEFLATCDTDDLCRLVNSGAFNDIIKAFLKIAAANSGIDEQLQDKMLCQLRWIFDEKSTKEVLENSEKY